MDGSDGRTAGRRLPSLGVKVAVIGALVLLLQLGSALTLSLVRERRQRSAEAAQEISDKWGGAQEVLGPVLTVPFADREGELLLGRFLPEDLAIDGTAVPEVRYYGIFRSVVYASRLTISGRFLPPDLSAWQAPPERVRWQDATLSLGLCDLKGISDTVAVTWGGARLVAEPGTGAHGFPARGVSVRIPAGSLRAGTPIEFSVTLPVNGSGRLGFHPLGKETRVRLASSWAHPGFDGAFLPEKRAIGPQGFTAQWRILHHNRSYPQSWFDVKKTTSHGESGNGPAIRESAFGVGLRVPVDHYRQVERSVKYGILFIGLTFMAFFATEIVTRRRLHPVQYLLVGLAMTLFYVILLALAEHAGFTAAYLAAAAAVVTLVGVYGRSALGARKPAAGVCGVLTALYGFLFVTLRLEDYALLVGALGVFGALAVFMMVTRKVDWYEIG